MITKVRIGIIITSLVLISFFVTPYLETTQTGGWTCYYDSNILPVQCLTQEGTVSEDYNIGSGICRLTVYSMIMLYEDETKGTSYFGQPYDHDLMIEFNENIEDSIREEYIAEFGTYGAYYQLDAWAWWRGQPRLKEIHRFYDYDWWTIYKGNTPEDLPDTDFDSYQFDIYYNLEDITYQSTRDLIDTIQSPLYLAHLWSSGSHATCGYGWCDVPYPHGMTYIHNTWDCYDGGVVPIDNQDFDDNYYVYRTMYPIFYDDAPDDFYTGDMNGDSSINSADIRYWAMNYLGASGYETLHSHPDTNNDGIVNAGDMRYLAMWMMGVPEYQPLYP